MRIAVLSRQFSRASGGAESYAVALVDGLAKRHDIHVFSQMSNQPVLGVTYHTIGCLGERPRWLNQLLFAVLTWSHTRKGFDIVHSHENTWHGQIQTIHVRPIRHNLFFGIHGIARLARWAKVVSSPRLLTYILLEGSRFKKRTGRQIVTTSNSLGKECEDVYPFIRGLLRVITPGVGLPRSLPPRLAARLDLGLPSASRLILFVANDFARKGLDTLLAALSLMPTDVSLAIVGNPKSAQKYRAISQQLGVEDRVHFLGSFDDLTVVYASADCLAHPTLEDSFAMVVIEAMAHGLPVVVSGPDQCGVSRQLTDQVNALLLSNPQNVRLLASKIISVLNDQDLAMRLRQAGLEFAHQHTWDNTVLQYEQIYIEASTATSNVHSTSF